MQQPGRSSPLLTGILLLCAGFLLRRWKPSALRLPERDENRSYNDSGVARAARKSRDGLATVMPGNLTGSVGRSLLVMGAGLIMVRALDGLVDDKDALF
tara:strand:+ start:377 stop:673 length:297 start_codon:yes stop_codon:yes gene_type:complete